MNDFAEKYANNVADFYRKLLRELYESDLARDLTIKAVPYLMPDQEPGIEGDE